MKYKNKNSDFIKEIKINLIDVKNIKAIIKFLNFSKKCLERKIKELLILLTDDVSCIIILHPGELDLYRYF